MNYVQLPCTDLHPSTICLGTSTIGSAIDQNTSFALLDAYVEQGGNFLDTAKIYADWLSAEKSLSEKTIGKWLQARHNRERIIVATKGGTSDPNTQRVGRLARTEIEYDLNLSLQNLRIEPIDIYWLHRDEPHRPVEEIMETLNAQVKAGKIRYFACSNWRLDRIVAAQNYALQHGFTGFVGNQMMWSYAEVDTHAMPDKTMVAMDDALRSYHADTGLAAIPYSSQAQGWFQRMATNTLGQMNPTTAGMFNGVINELRFARLTHLATESGLSLTDLILGYLQSQPFPTLPIIGCRTPDQLRDSMHAGDIRLSRDQMAFLEQDSISSRANAKAGNRNI